MKSWRPATRTQYSVYVNKWMQFINNRNIDICSPVSVNIVLEFLTMLHEQGLSYSAINTARSALSTFVTLNDNNTLGSNPLVQRFMRGIFNIKPNLPKYVQSWDVSKVLGFINSMGDNTTLSLKQISMKLAMLIALTSGQRVQTLSVLKTNQMFVYDDRVEFNVDSLLKQSRPRYHLKPMVIMKYSNDRLCVVHALESYINKTRNIRSDTSLFISTQKPHKAVSRDTISRWLKSLLQLSGIDVSIFKGQSTRQSATSAASRADVPLNIIMDKAGWSSAKTFAKFYNKPLSLSGQFESAIYNNDMLAKLD